MPFQPALRRLRRSDLAASVILLGFVILAAAYSRATPAFEPPDEGPHLLYAHNILVEGRLPLLADRASVFASQSTQRHHMPLYYLIGALLISGTDRSDLDQFLLQNHLAAIGQVAINNQNLYLHPLDPPTDGTLRAVAILRAYSLTLAVGTLLLIYYGASRLFSPRIGVIVLLLAASIPTFIFISASISNDNLVTLLVTAGVVWCIDVWRRARLTLRDTVLLGIILGGTALSKHNGAALFGIVGVVVFAGALTRRWSWRAALRTLALAGALVVALAGWWYVRNYQLYGDALALRASQQIWGRGDSINTTVTGVLDEARGIYYSFWMTLGYLNVGGPEWLYPYTFVLTAGGALGSLVLLVRAIRQRQSERVFALGLCWLVALAAVAAQIATTRQIASSQGRILFPGLLGFASLIVVGWSAWLPRRPLPLLIVPIAAAALTGPLIFLPDAYRPLTVVRELDARAQPITAAAEGLRLLAYTLDQRAAAPGDRVTGALYFTGAHPDNPRLILRAIDRRSGAILGGAEFYPGMIPTATLDPSQIYRAPFRFDLDAAATPLAPVQLGLLVDWRTLENGDPAQGRYLTWDEGHPPILDAWTLVDPAYAPPPPAVSVSATFGGSIRLEGYTLEAGSIRLIWRTLAPPDGDYTLALGAFDAAGAVVAQADGAPPGFPTSAWAAGQIFEDVRAFAPPPQAAALYLGWYRAADGARLPADPDPRGDDLVVIPLPR
ncbi:MAG: ArnT family glycosyltransferase [Candidatus Flexifilum sp.]